MKLNVYNANLERILIIEDHFVSCYWSEGYNTVGKFSLELIATKEYREKIKPEYFVGRSDRKALMVIKSVEESGGRIVAVGAQAFKVLEDVAFLGTIEKGVPVDTAVKNAYNESDRLSFLFVHDTGTADLTSQPVHRGQLLDIALDLCQQKDIGIKAERDGNLVSVSFYKPEKKENLVFSERFGNAVIDSMLFSTEGHKNAVVCFYLTPEGEEKYMEVDQSNGENKRVLIADSTVQWEEDDTEETYKEKVEDYCETLLNECKKVFDFVFNPISKDFGTRYDLGDILTVLLPDGNGKIEARVVRFTEKCQNNKSQLKIDVGDIMIKR